MAEKNVDNVKINVGFSEEKELKVLNSGERLSVLMGKLAKGVRDLIAHIADNVKHVTREERTKWNGKADKAQIAYLQQVANYSENAVVSGVTDYPKVISIPSMSHGVFYICAGPGGHAEAYLRCILDIAYHGSGDGTGISGTMIYVSQTPLGYKLFYSYNSETDTVDIYIPRRYSFFVEISDLKPADRRANKPIIHVPPYEYLTSVPETAVYPPEPYLNTVNGGTINIGDLKYNLIEGKSVFHITQSNNASGAYLDGNEIAYIESVNNNAQAILGSVYAYCNLKLDFIGEKYQFNSYASLNNLINGVCLERGFDGARNFRLCARKIGTTNKVQLGSSDAHWTDLYVDNIHCTNPPWASAASVNDIELAMCDLYESINKEET